MSPTSVTLPDRIAVLPIRSTIVFPMGATALQIGFEPNVEALQAHPERELVVALVAVFEDGLPDPKALEKVASAVRVLDRLNLPGGTIQCTLQGLRRIRLEEVKLEEGYYTARPVAAEETRVGEEEADTLIEQILHTLGGMAARVERIPDEVPRVLRMNLRDPGRFADLAATLCNLKLPDRDAVLQELDVAARLRLVLRALEEEWERIQAIDEEHEAATGEAKAAQPLPAAPRDRTTEIRRRIQALQAQLGEIDPNEREANEILRKVDRAELPSRIASIARREAERLRASTTSSSDATELRTYVETLISVPWNRRESDGSIDLAAVEASIDEEHLGLDEVKQRLMEVMAVAELRGDLRGPIPCIVGPPGVGKRTLAMAIARGLGRPFVRLELGGRGEPQLIGSRRGRAGATMGKIMAAIREAGARDCVLFLEELDEVGLGSVDGDPVETLEEALHPENREEFTDRYLDTPFDLSDVFFIGSAAEYYRIPRDLRNYFIEIRIAGYTPEEKIAIAREWLLPRIVAEHGLEPESVRISDETLLFLTRGYARDAGVGNLRRSLAAVMRYVAREKAEGRSTEGWTITQETIETVLGYPRYTTTLAESAPEVGVVTGLAWTASGGELMFIEALKMPGTGRLIITGLLGDVMRESVNAAFSYVRSRADHLGIDGDAFEKYDLHVHFPVGATPKDGPSAGAAVTLAIASSLSEKPVRHDVALTGEVTLRGKILEIGGVKEKTLAAYRSGLRVVVLPTANKRDLRDVPADVREKMEFHFVDRMDEVLDLALIGCAVRDATQRDDAGRTGRAEGEPRAAAEGRGPGE